jgi:hypothetical protein
MGSVDIEHSYVTPFEPCEPNPLGLIDPYHTLVLDHVLDAGVHEETNPAPSGAYGSCLVTVPFDRVASKKMGLPPEFEA